MRSNYDYGTAFLSRRDLVKGVRKYSRLADKHADDCDGTCRNPYEPILAAYEAELTRRDNGPTSTRTPDFNDAVRQVEALLGRD